MRNGNFDRGNSETLKLAALLAVGTLAFTGALDYASGLITDREYGSGQAKSYLEQSGYTNPLLIETDRFLVHGRGCGSEDNAEYKFAAETPQGTEVQVIVCKGLHDAATLHQR